MRAKVASMAGGHAYEERFTSLTSEQLVILYRQAIKEESEKEKNLADTIRVVFEILFKKLDSVSEMSQLFSNPQLFKRKLEMQEIGEHQKEIKAEDFDEVWEEMMKIIPEEYVVEDIEQVEPEMESDPEFDRLVSGWVNSRKER